MVIKRNNQVVNGGKFLFTLVLLSLAVQSVSVYGSTSAVPLQSVDKERLSKEYKKQREEIFAKADFLFEAAKKFDEQEKYVEAIEKCTLALEELKKIGGAYVNFKRTAITNYKRKLVRSWGTTLWNTANTFFVIKKDYQNAKKLALKAKQADDFFAERADELIKKCDKALSANNFKEKIAIEAVDFEREQRDEKATSWLAEAKVLMENQLYTESRDKLEAVLIIDPLNVNAGRMLKKVYQEIYIAGQNRRAVAFEDITADAAWRWISPVPPSDSVTIDLPSPSIASIEAGSLYDKLQSTIVSYVSWEDSNIFSVISELRELSIEADEEKIGINILSKISSEASSIPNVTLRFTNIPLIELVKYVCQATGLNYSVENNTLSIGDKGVTPVATRRFPIKNDFYNSIVGGGAGSSSVDLLDPDAEGGDLGEDFITESEGVGSAGQAARSDDAALKEYFSNAGVIFGPDSKITYNARNTQLVVTNTPEQLRKIKDLIDQLDIATPMILIEAKLIELTEQSVFELGFDWFFGVSDTNGDDYILIQPSVRHWTGFGTAPVPNNTIDAPFPGKIVDDLRIIPNLIEGTNSVLTLTVYGLNNNTRNEVLSAPKILATSGTSAFIQMVQTRLFPDSWEDPEVNVNDSTVQIVPPVPEFEDDGQDLGITLDVDATVATNNYTITLTVHPRVANFVGYDEYPFVITQSATGENYEGVIAMPRIARREVRSTIKLYDGESIVIGGIIREEVQKIEDKYPGFAEVPFFGGFFTAQYDSKVKSNLLIFINARLVDYSGVPIRSIEKDGTPDYRR